MVLAQPLLVSLMFLGDQMARQELHASEWLETTSLKGRS